jgi:hypothetical protein
MLIVFVAILMAGSIGLLRFVSRLGPIKADEYRLPFGGM